MSLQTYRDLQVWQKAIDPIESVYQVTKKFPADERFGLTCQIQRAAVSIASNIAEGYGRSHRGDYLRHLSIAKGSLAEMETQLVIAGRLLFITKDDARQPWDLAQQVGRMLHKLIASLQDSAEPRTPNPEP